MSHILHIVQYMGLFEKSVNLRSVEFSEARFLGST
jgi:hypothetical protein